MAFIALLLFLVAAAFIAFPIWVIVRLNSVSGELRRTRADLEALRASKPPPQEPPPVIVPGPVAAPPEACVPPPVAEPPAIPPAILSAPPAVESGISDAAPSSPAVEPPAISAPAPAQPVALPQLPPPAPPPLPQREQPAHPFNLEVFMGTKFLSWLGGLAAFLAVAFFLKYSIEHGLVSPIVRVALGFVFGAGLIVGGLVAARKHYAVLGHTLCATGIVSLYGVTFACRALYHFPFFGVVPTFALMVLITVAAFAIAVNLDGKFVAVLGILGGFLTPKLLETGVDNPLGLFAYIALLDIGLYAVALRKRWNFLVPLGALCTAIMQAGWACKFLGDHNTLVAIAVCLVFDALFLAGFVAARRMARETSMHSRSVAALVFVSFGFALYLALDSVEAWRPWVLFGFVFLADACALAVTALKRRASLLPGFAGLAVFALLAVWTVSAPVTAMPLMPWALGAYFVFAVMHTAFPLVLARVRGLDGGDFPGVLVHLFAPLALVLVLVPVVRSPEAPFLVWPAILLIDLLAIVLAALTRKIAGVVLSLVLTLAAAACWVFQIPARMPEVPVSLLLVIGGFAVLFFAASLWLGRRFAARGGDAGGVFANQNKQFTTVLPALSALLPFVLIVMMETRLNLDDPTPVFGLGLLLTVLTLGLARMLRHEWLPACALGGVLAISYVWWQGALRFAMLPEANMAAGVGFGWFIGFYLIFTAFPFVFRSCFLNTRGAWLASAATGMLFFPLFYGMIKTLWPGDFMGLVPAAFAVPALLCMVAVLRLDAPEHPRRTGRIVMYAGAALLFVTLIFPVQFSREWITIGWALEGAALLWLNRRVPHRLLPWAGFALLTVAFVRLAFNVAVFSYHVRGEWPILNWYLYTYGIVIVSLFVGAALLRNSRSKGFPLGALLPAFGAVLAFLLLNIEIADYFCEPGSRALTFEFSGNFARDMTYTIAWALFALALLVCGIWKKRRAARFAALGLLAVVVLKLFFHDLAYLDTLYRVAAFFAVAVVMILASFLYQKYLAPHHAAKTPPPAPPPVPPASSAPPPIPPAQ